MQAAPLLDAIREAPGACGGFSPRMAVADLTADHRLIEDLGLDSVALLDLVGLESRLGRDTASIAIARGAAILATR